LQWLAPTYDGGYEGLIYNIEKLSGNQWVLVSRTRNLYLLISDQLPGTTEVYRAIATTEGGSSLPSNEVEVFIPANSVVDPNTSTEDVTNVAGTVSVTQGGTGSWQATVSWSFVAGASRYRIEMVRVGSDIWSQVATVSGLSHSFTIRPGVRVLLKVTANTGKFVGITEYLGN
jgi:hypothetical protein